MEEYILFILLFVPYRFVIVPFELTKLVIVILLPSIFTNTEFRPYNVLAVILVAFTVPPTIKLLAILAPPASVNPPPLVKLVTSSVQFIEIPPLLISEPDVEFKELVVPEMYKFETVELI